MAPEPSGRTRPAADLEAPRKQSVLTTFRRKNDFVARSAPAREHDTWAAALRPRWYQGGWTNSALGRGGESVADVDQVVGDDAQAHPTLDARQALVATAVESMAALEKTDTTLTASAPLLGVAEPAFLLEALALHTFAGAIGDSDSLDAAGLRGELIALREERGIGGDEIRHATQELPVNVQGGKQQIAVPGALPVDLVVRDDLRFGFLDLHHLAKLGGLGGFTLTDHLGVRLEQAHELAGHVRVALEDALARLVHDLPHPWDHPLKIGSVRLQTDLLQKAAGTLATGGDFLGEALGLPDHPGAVVQELAVAGLEPLLALLHHTAAAGAGDLPDLIAHRAGAIAQPRTGAPCDLGNTLHGAGEHPYAIPQQGAVGRVVDIGLHHRGVHTEPAAANDPLLAGDGDHTGVELLDDLGTEHQSEPAEGLGIGNLLRPHPRELPIHQVCAHLALEHVVAPVTYVLEQQQPQHHFGGRARPAPCTAIGPTLCESLVDDLHQLAVGEQWIDLTHPLFPQRAYFLLDQALGEGQLCSRGLDQLSSAGACGSAWPAPAACRARASSTVARDCPQRSPSRSAETHATPPARHERSPPAAPAHTPNAPCLRPCSGNKGAGHDDSPDRVRRHRRGLRTGGSTLTVTPAPSRLRPVRARAGAYPYYSLSRKVTKPYLPRQARVQHWALPACLRDQIRYDRAGNPGAAGKTAAQRRIIFAPESNYHSGANGDLQTIAAIHPV